MALKSLPFADWPASDQALWRDAIADGGYFGISGPFVDLKPVSQSKIMRSYGYWLAWLARVDAAALSLSPALRMTPERLLRWRQDISHYSAWTRLMLISQSLALLRRTHPEMDWIRQSCVESRARSDLRDAVPTRKLGRILSSAVLLQGGLDLTAACYTRPKPARRAAGIRDGLLIATLAMLPARRRAFLSLELGKSIHLTADSIKIDLDVSMTKTARSWDCSLPDVLVPGLRDYIRHHRPILMARSTFRHDYLWVNDHGNPYGPGHFTDRFKRLTRRLFGVAISPHLFRDSAATTLARHAPEHALLIRALLAHSGHSTATRYYNHAQMIDDGRSYADLISNRGGLVRCVMSSFTPAIRPICNALLQSMTKSGCAQTIAPKWVGLWAQSSAMPHNPPRP